LVIYMGLLSLPNLIENLVAQKTSKFLPVAVIESGTLSSQKVVTGNLKNIETKVKKAKIKSPALIIIGQVVKLREKLNWFN
jgi:siroheme synthase